MFKNVASQKIAVYAFDATTGIPKTGDAANLTAYVSKDFGAVTVLGDTSATEMDATNAKGMYLFDTTQGETNADCAIFTAKSTTANIYIAPQTIYTLPASFTAFVTPPTAVANADALLDRDMSTGADSGSTTVRTVRQALRFSRNKVSIAAGTMTVTKEDDATSSWTAAITTTAGDPITSIDPAGP